MNRSREIYKYLKSHSHSSVHEIAKATRFGELEVLRRLNRLCDRRLVNMDYSPSLDSKNNCSCFYSVANAHI